MSLMMRFKQDKMIHKHMVTLAVGRFIVIAPNVQFFLLAQILSGCCVKISGPIWLEKMQIEKTVFIVFFAGDWSRMKITKICDAFGANQYHFPEDARQQQQMISEVLILGLIKN
jgi:hypothetical protein